MKLIFLRCQFRTWCCLFLAPLSLQQHANYAAALKFAVNLGSARSDRLPLSPVRHSLAVFFLCVGTRQQVANPYLPRPARLMLSVSGFLNPSSQQASGDETLFCHSPLSCFGAERWRNVSGAWREGRCLSQVFDWLLERLHHCLLREKKKPTFT